MRYNRYHNAEIFSYRPRSIWSFSRIISHGLSMIWVLRPRCSNREQGELKDTAQQDLLFELNNKQSLFLLRTLPLDPKWIQTIFLANSVVPYLISLLSQFEHVDYRPQTKLNLAQITTKNSNTARTITK